MTKQQQDIYRYYLKFRYRLFPYIYSAAIDAHLTGKPILAPLSFYHFSDKTSYDYEYEFMFGESFLAAPVLKKEVNQWEVYLPKGQWINYWTGQKFSGEQKVTISAKLYENESLPLFVKAGAIIPMYADRYTITDERPKLLKLDIYPEGNSNYTLLEKQSANPKDTVEKTKIECLSNKKDVVVEFDSKYEELELCLHLDKKPKEIFINDQKIAVLKSLNDFETVKEGWYYGTGVFYGSKTMKTINVKHSGVGKCKVRIVR